MTDWETIKLAATGEDWRKIFQGPARAVAYDHYLESQWWSHKRQERLIVDGDQCKTCGLSINLNVHHLTYRNIGNEDVANDLVTLCRSCHEAEHGLPSSEGLVLVSAITGTVLDAILWRARATIPASVKSEFRREAKA